MKNCTDPLEANSKRQLKVCGYGKKAEQVKEIKAKLAVLSHDLLSEHISTAELEVKLRERSNLMLRLENLNADRRVKYVVGVRVVGHRL